MLSVFPHELIVFDSHLPAEDFIERLKEYRRERATSYILESPNSKQVLEGIVTVNEIRLQEIDYFFPGPASRNNNPEIIGKARTTAEGCLIRVLIKMEQIALLTIYFLSAAWLTGIGYLAYSSSPSQAPSPLLPPVILLPPIIFFFVRWRYIYLRNRAKKTMLRIFSEIEKA